MMSVESVLPAAKSADQRVNGNGNAGRGARISERHRDLVIRLAEASADLPGPTSAVVVSRLRRQHIRHIGIEDVDRILAEDKREWRQRALTLEGHVLAGIREFNAIPRENREERAW